MSTGRFAFIIHPLSISDVARKFPIARRLPDGVVKSLLRFVPALKASHIEGIRSDYGAAEGWFIGCPLTPEMMFSLPEKAVLAKITKAAQLAERLGAKIVGLGALTSVVGDAGLTVARGVNIAVTTGNSYTVATALEGVYEAAELMGIDLETAEVAIIGGGGSIGSACAEILARRVGHMVLVGRNLSRLEIAAQRVVHATGLAPRLATDSRAAIRDADIVVAVSSTAEAVIEPQDLKIGAVVCDVARPRDVSPAVVQQRDDVLVIEGGVVEVPGQVDFHFDFGFPPGKSYACMAETMILAMEGRYESFSLGRELSVAKIDEISRLAKKHGFRLAGFRSFDRALSWQEIERVRENALRRRSLS
ncbi:MAG TPA: shikimate dehydrogenase [Firmicutes bacterium]|nr:shikimate dehydrogenase [Bacillota bacterium]